MDARRRAQASPGCETTNGRLFRLCFALGLIGCFSNELGRFLQQLRQGYGQGSGAGRRNNGSSRGVGGVADEAVDGACLLAQGYYHITCQDTSLGRRMDKIWDVARTFVLQGMLVHRTSRLVTGGSISGGGSGVAGVAGVDGSSSGAGFAGTFAGTSAGAGAGASAFTAATATAVPSPATVTAAVPAAGPARPTSAASTVDLSILPLLLPAPLAAGRGPGVSYARKTRVMVTVTEEDECPASFGGSGSPGGSGSSGSLGCPGCSSSSADTGTATDTSTTLMYYHAAFLWACAGAVLGALGCDPADWAAVDELSLGQVAHEVLQLAEAEHRQRDLEEQAKRRGITDFGNVLTRGLAMGMHGASAKEERFAFSLAVCNAADRDRDHDPTHSIINTLRSRMHDMERRNRKLRYELFRASEK